jgi:hypothetical protein
MIGMGAKSSTIVTAVTADFFFDCWAAEVPSDECTRDIPVVLNRSREFKLTALLKFYLLLLVAKYIFGPEKALLRGSEIIVNI